MWMFCKNGCVHLSKKKKKGVYNRNVGFRCAK